MKQIVLASNNKHKIKEFREILSDCEIYSLEDVYYTEDIEENGNSFFENAMIKAKVVSEYLKKKSVFVPVIADDSGLCVESLNGAPGIYSARYSGDHDIVANRAKLQKELANKDNRNAYFNCTLVELYPDGTYITAEGKTHGLITKDERGDKSFGYDCVFYSNDLKKTFGEASAEEKNMVSHRRRAIEQLKELRNR